MKIPGKGGREGGPAQGWEGWERWENAGVCLILHHSIFYLFVSHAPCPTSPPPPFSIHSTCRYRRLEWVRAVRRWPPRMVEELDAFLNFKLPGASKAAKFKAAAAEKAAAAAEAASSPVAEEAAAGTAAAEGVVGV